MAFGTPPISSVSPSGAARATCSVPMLVPAPGLFSMITEVLSATPSGCVNSRVTMSTVPPGGNGTTILTVLPAGQSPCACAGPPERAMRSANQMPMNGARLRMHSSRFEQENSRAV